MKTEQKWVRVKDVDGTIFLVNPTYVVCIEGYGDGCKIWLSTERYIEMSQNVNDTLLKFKILDESKKG